MKKQMTMEEVFDEFGIDNSKANRDFMEVVAARLVTVVKRGGEINGETIETAMRESLAFMEEVGKPFNKLHSTTDGLEKLSDEVYNDIKA